MDMTQPAVGRAVRRSAAEEIIARAGRLALDYFDRYRLLDVSVKSSPQDIVSVADLSVETFIRTALAERFPDDGLVGEEHGHSPGTSGYCWLIDPIDGTSPFLHGLRSWCVVMALLEGERPVLGLIYDACAGELYVAGAGEGAVLNGRPIRVDGVSSLEAGLTAISAVSQVDSASLAGVIGRLHEAGGAFMRIGSAALTLANVAAGRYVGYYEPRLHAWDCVAGLLLVSEAGGRVDAFGGGLLGTGKVFAAAPQVADQLRRIVSGP